MLSLIQAPLAGYSCAPMRKLAHQWGRPDYSCTEMLSARHIFSGNRQKKRFEYKDPDEGRLCYQIAGNSVDVLVKTCEVVQGWGADLIDLNCGCPQPKIRKKGTGSKLLDDPLHLYTLVAAMVAHSNVPVTVKIRVSPHTLDVARAIESAGAAALIVHGRTWQERYDTPVSMARIADVVRAVNIPVIANGDISDTPSARAMLEQTGCKGLMVARASLGQPWLFDKIRTELDGGVFKVPGREHIAAMLKQHARELVDLEGERMAMFQCRKLVKYYFRDSLTGAQKAMACELLSLSDLDRCCEA
jgi:tRNA-dihydrouridine synthase B